MELIEFLNSFFSDDQIDYKEKLSIQDASEGIEKAIENANDLLEDSLILFNSGKYPRAIALGIMAVEEIGKIEIIKKILLSNQNVGKTWNDFKKHQLKNHIWLWPILRKFQVPYTEISSFEGIGSSWVKRIDDLKNNSLYLNGKSFLDTKKITWELPKNKFDKDFCGMFLYIATEVVKDDRIIWNNRVLEIFKKFHFLDENENINSHNSIGFFKELLEEKLITKERFSKILDNYGI